MDIQEYPRPESISSGFYETDKDELILDDDIDKADSDIKPKLSLWEEILQEFEDERHLNTPTATVEDETQPPDVLSAKDYLEKEIYPVLLPALEDTLKKAIEWKVLRIQKSRFNGVDNIAEYLWNNNPKHDRGNPPLDIFDIPFAIQSLREHPRPIFPLSWLLTDDEAARMIQKAVRGFLVRRRDDVQEMRQFWKALEQDRRLELAEAERLAAEEKASVENYISEIGEEILDNVLAQISVESVYDQGYDYKEDDDVIENVVDYVNENDVEDDNKEDLEYDNNDLAYDSNDFEDDYHEELQEDKKEVIEEIGEEVLNEEKANLEEGMKKRDECECACLHIIS